MTSFDDDSSRPPALPSSSDDAFVDNGAVASKPCFSLAERRPGTAADGLLPADTASTATRTVFSWSLLSLTFDEEAKKRTSRTNNNQIAPPYWKKIIQMKSSQTLVFDPGGCIGRICSCPILGGWHALRVGRAYLDAAIVVKARAFSVHVNIISRRRQAIRTYCGQSVFPIKQPIMRIEDRLFDRGWVRSAMVTRKCENFYFRKYFMAFRKFTNIFVLLLILMVGSRDTLFLVCFT